MVSGIQLPDWRHQESRADVRTRTSDPVADWLREWAQNGARTPFAKSPEKHRDGLDLSSGLEKCPDLSWVYGTCWLRQSALLIHPQWILASWHWRYGPGGKPGFVDRKTGEMRSAKVAQTFKIGKRGDDLSLSRLSSPVDWVDPVDLPPVSRTLRKGTPLLVTLDGPALRPGSCAGAYSLLWIKGQIKVRIQGGAVLPGDSNHPSFAAIGGKLVPVCIFNIQLRNGDGAGTFLGRKDIRSEIESYISP